jgi:hypothetical protein
MIKTGKKLNLPLDERFKISYGTVNVKNPTSIYLQISTWIKPLEDNNNLNYNHSNGVFEKLCYV